MELLEGRKWVYAANPLMVQINSGNIYKTSLLNYGENIKANIFKTSWGEYAVVVLALPKGLALKDQRHASLAIKVKVPENDTLRQAVVFGADYKGYSLAKPVSAGDGYLEIAVPRHGVATMVILTNNFNHLRSMRKWTKFSELVKKG